MKVKICGITNLNDALLCEASGADLLGFIFFNKSKRFINFAEAIQIIKKLSLFTIKVGVFVNESPELINSIVSQLKLNAVQLHGNETPELAAKIEAPVIKSFSVKDNFNFDAINEFKNITPLLDTFSNIQYGGTGKSFNWKIIPKNIRTNIILSGGISYRNIEDVIKEVNPIAVDLSSSLESEPGKKDEIKVKEFFNKINQIRRALW
ncbi:MAG: phosphoribosylanthranilate isomerase [Ignavibacteriales bacterium]|nr:phosphoribosylanthranilate isomerase [Ignavibacteriales bacterium]